MGGREYYYQLILSSTLAYAEIEFNKKSITCYYMLYKGIGICYLNLYVHALFMLFDTNYDFTEMFLMMHIPLPNLTVDYKWPPELKLEISLNDWPK